ncbi:MAG: hypothetical protein U0670_02380 [Anaerolineae bacterium]
MIKPRFIAAGILVLTLVSACEMLDSTPDPSGDASGTATALPYGTVPTHTREWLQLSINEIEVGIWLPAGWIADYQDGLIMAEHVASFSTSSQGLAGMLVYVFSPSLDRFDTATAEPLTPSVGESSDHNMAWSILTQAVHKPDMIGSAAVSEPVGFKWDGHDAAYYLLTDPDGIHMLVLAVALPNSKMLVINVSVPPDFDDSEDGNLRDLVPAMLDGMTVNEAVMHGEGLEALPDPLVFPPLPVPASS